MNNTILNHTKIIATIGPASASPETLRALVNAGMNVCRLNFSHMDYAKATEIIEEIKKINNETLFPVALMADLQGPKLRVGNMGCDGAELKANELVIITSEECEGTSERFTLRYPMLSRDLKPGERILLDDGKMEVHITRVLNEKEVEAKVIRAGILKSNKGFNLPGSNVSLPALTEKDLKDLEFALSADVDWVAISFVRRPEDVLELKRRIADSGKTARVIAKIEKPEAIEHIDEIIEATDAIMIARGDLGIELPLQEVPILQKNIIEKTVTAAKPVIVATQMMESMMTSTMPSRAEVNDVANAVTDGASAVMLSGETSVGMYPVETVATMHRIITDVERDSRPYTKGAMPKSEVEVSTAYEISFMASRMAKFMNAKGIVVMTATGSSAFRMSSFRPKSHIFVFTNDHKLLRTLMLAWGLRGFYYDDFQSTDQSICDTIATLKSHNLVSEGDTIIHTASMPIKQRGTSNTIKVSVV